MSENQSDNEVPMDIIDSDDDEDSSAGGDNEDAASNRNQRFRNIMNMLSTDRLEISIQRFLQRPQNNDQQNTEQITSEENADHFDTELPAEHSYLGNLDPVTGVDYLEPGKHFKLLVLTAHSLVFPGETIPMIVPADMFDTPEFLEDQGDGCLFGIVFPDISYETGIFGVTCQIYEKGHDTRGHLTIKSRACQRFVITREKNPSLFPEISLPSRRKVFAICEILPEIVLADPLLGSESNSYAKFRMNKKMREKIRQRESGCMPWPKFVYDQYDVSQTLPKIDAFLLTCQIDTMPTDPVSLSFWCGKNVLLDNSDKLKVFITDSVTKRMMIIGKSLHSVRHFICRRCKSKVANYNKMFAMSKQGVQSNYCNPSGFIHETNTIYSAIPESIYLTGAPSTEFSWFPGYAWQIANCSCCDSHLGWKFSATKTNFVPKTFYGLTGTSVLIETDDKGHDESG